MSHAAPRRLTLLAAFAAIYLFWGATFLAVRYAVLVVPPMLIIFFRCAGGALILSGWLTWRGELERTTWPQWRTAAIAGLLLFLGCHVALAWAEQRMSSGQAALFSSTIPLWIVLIESAKARAIPIARMLVGIALGIIGVGVLAGGGALNAGLAGDRALVTIGAFCWAAGSLVGRHGARPHSATQSTAMQLASGALWVFAASALHGDLTHFSAARLDLRADLALLFLVVCGTVIGFGAYTWLLRVASPAAVSSYAFVNPMVALALGVAVGDDALSSRIVLSAALVIAAVVLTRGNAPAARASPADAAETRLRIAS